MLDPTTCHAYGGWGRHLVPLQETCKLDAHSGREATGNRACKTQHSVPVADGQKQTAHFAARSQIGNITNDYERPPHGAFSDQFE